MNSKEWTKWVEAEEDDEVYSVIKKIILDLAALESFCEGLKGVNDDLRGKLADITTKLSGSVPAEKLRKLVRICDKRRYKDNYELIFMAHEDGEGKLTATLTLGDFRALIDECRKELEEETKK